ncbi:hypothetical protein [Flavobacterium hungaricum]|uniref:Carboxypeptidase-like regulatory domain-containing protein n=1 Tax=Flavobacterium hungaricum TaxID=2082725 RepID=A0ABR9TIQ0_9FLAO|nr:hypothetical protein [Flavobacterium hungaricum]MBE8725231.1 hypothetical protein [Flavobacterium hungaricum]
MKVKLLTTISFFTYQLSISQTEKLLKGKVVDQSYSLKDVEVINKTAFTSTRTNELGEFSILVNPQDSLFFFHKNYFFTRIRITAENIQTNNLVIKMILKPEELDEVLVSRSVFTKGDIHKIVNDREATNEIIVRKQFDDVTSKVNVYDGKIKNAVNLSYPIFDKPKKKIEVDNRFKKLVKASCPPDFFTNDLKIKADEKEIFLNYCNDDPKSKTLLEKSNILELMDFLYAKNEEFKKL